MTSLHLTDLAQPLLSEHQRRAMRDAERCPVTLSEQAVLQAAIDATGLDDFGEPDFRERLAVWLEAGTQDIGLNALGRAVLFGYCVRYASNRLRLEDLVRRHPEILAERIARPVFIAGLPRSGTTSLINLMGRDARWRSLPYWEAVAPFPGLAGGFDSSLADPRRLQCLREWEQFDALLPHLKAMHEMSPDHIHEDLELQALDFTSYNIEWTAHVPRWRDWYLAHDRQTHYAYLRKALQALQWQDRRAGRAPRRWLLKCPQHLENLGAVMQTFPDATLVLTHRDPLEVIQSAATMVAYGDRVRRHRIDLRLTTDYWIDRIARMLEACVRDRASVPDAQSMDVPFAHYVADEAGTLERIYALAGEALNPDGARAVRNEIKARSDAHVRVAYDLFDTLGIDTTALRQRFAFYLDRFPALR
ncbi:MAG TPA: sulfotransferase [Burkholderiaceae bacterium]|nr:sulfotransferase [Burkholderiaceae bacterium]